MMARRMWRGPRGRDEQPSAPGDCPDDGGQAPGTDGRPGTNGLAADGQASAGATAPGTTPGREPPVPAWLQRAAGWAWRLLILGIVGYLALRIASAMRAVLLPCVAALLLTALLQPLARRLREAGMPRLAATWCALLTAVAVLAGALALAVTQTSASYRTLVREVGQTATRLQHWLAGPPFHLHQRGLEELSGRLLTYLKGHQAAVAGAVLGGGKIFLELLAGLVLMLFVTFFLLKDGERIWGWLTSFLRPRARERATGAGLAVWQALTYYVRGTIMVASIHAIVIGTALWIMGVPLVVPLIIAVFLAAFVPLVGILAAGTLAVAVTLGTRGWIAALVLVAIFIVENQLESHLLQPLVVGRMVRLHPLAIILVLAVGGIVGGIPGAIVAVPTAASLTRAVPYLQGRVPVTPRPPSRPGIMRLRR